MGTASTVNKTNTRCRLHAGSSLNTELDTSHHQSFARLKLSVFGRGSIARKVDSCKY